MSNTQKKIAIGFIVYRPEVSFFDRLIEIDNANLATFIYDNSPELTTTKDFVDQFSGIHYSSSGKNAGLGVGLYELCRAAYLENFETLLFFDQDTKFKLDTISFISNFYAKKGSELLAKYSAICFSGKQDLIHGQTEHPFFIDANIVINSGSLFILKNLKKMGWHNQSYFVDGVDYEFCLRSHIFGFKIGKHLNTPNFDHESEQPDGVVTIFGKRLLVRRYSPARVKDAFHSYIRLIYCAIRSCQLKFALVFFRSFLIYIFGQVLARISGQVK